MVKKILKLLYKITYFCKKSCRFTIRRVKLRQLWKVYLDLSDQITATDTTDTATTVKKPNVKAKIVEIMDNQNGLEAEKELDNKKRMYYGMRDTENSSGIISNKIFW